MQLLKCIRETVLECVTDIFCNFGDAYNFRKKLKVRNDYNKLVHCFCFKHNVPEDICRMLLNYVDCSRDEWMLGLESHFWAMKMSTKFRIWPKRNRIVLGTQVIYSGIYMWKLRLNSYPNIPKMVGLSFEQIKIGIALNNSKLCYMASGPFGLLRPKYQSPTQVLGALTWMYANDIVWILLDMEKRTLSFKVNHAPLIKAYEDLEFGKHGYRLMITTKTVCNIEILPISDLDIERFEE